MTAGSSAATGDSRQLNSSQSAATSQQRQLSSSNSQLRDNQSAAATQQQSGNSNQVSDSQLTTESSATTSQQQAAQRQPVDNREFSKNRFNRDNDCNSPVQDNNVCAEGGCQRRPGVSTSSIGGSIPDVRGNNATRRQRSAEEEIPTSKGSFTQRMTLVAGESYE